MTRSEAATLIGMILVVGSLFLTWQRSTQSNPLMAASALYRAATLIVSWTGFAAGVWQPLTVCAVISASTLLWTSTAQNRVGIAIVQSGCALGCLVIALIHFALLSGVLVGLIGGALLTFGAVDRFNMDTKLLDTKLHN